MAGTILSFARPHMNPNAKATLAAIGAILLTMQCYASYTWCQAKNPNGHKCNCVAMPNKRFCKNHAKQEPDRKAQANAINVGNLAVQQNQDKQQIKVYKIGNGEIVLWDSARNVFITKKLPALTQRQRNDNIRAYMATEQINREFYIEEHPEDPDGLYYKPTNAMDWETGAIIAVPQDDNE